MANIAAANPTDPQAILAQQQALMQLRLVEEQQRQQSAQNALVQRQLLQLGIHGPRAIILTSSMSVDRIESIDPHKQQQAEQSAISAQIQQQLAQNQQLNLQKLKSQEQRQSPSISRSAAQKKEMGRYFIYNFFMYCKRIHEVFLFDTVFL